MAYRATAFCYWSAVVTLYVIGIFGVVSYARGETLWSDPGSDPFAGTMEEGITQLSEAGAPHVVLINLGRAYEAGECNRRQLHPGERIALMTSGSGVKRDMTVATYEWVTDCESPFGEHLLRPDICGNWSYDSVPTIRSNGGSSVWPSSGGWRDYGDIAWWGSLAGDNTSPESFLVSPAYAPQIYFPTGTPAPVNEPEMTIIFIMGVIIVFYLKRIRSSNQPWT